MNQEQEAAKTAATTTAAATAAAVSVKLPTFWTTMAAAWFTQAEAQFGLRGITSDDTRYWHVVAALDAETATRAASILQHPPPTDRYITLKEFLVSAYELSAPERADRLLSITELGDRRPSELMDVILRLNGSAGQHFLLRQIFLRALPNTARQALATSTTRDLWMLSLEADTVVAASRGASAALLGADVATDSSPEISAVRRSSQHHPKLCFFHRRFGRKARKCEPPCEWSSSGNASAGPH